jgi:hypothetical protein
MRIQYGTILIGIGVVHELVGLVLGWDVMAGAFRSGFVGAIEADWQRQALFWFHVSGFMMLAFGEALRALQIERGAMPARFGIILLAIGVFGAAAIPGSGFWLAIALALFMLGGSWRARTERSLAN